MYRNHAETKDCFGCCKCVSGFSGSVGLIGLRLPLALLVFGNGEDIPLKPAITQELFSDMSGLGGSGAYSVPHDCDATGDSCKDCASAVVMIALSLGVTGVCFSRAEAAELPVIAALPPVSDLPDALPSYGADAPSEVSASYHTVASGDTLWKIAQTYGVDVETVRVVNALSEDQVIRAGQVLRVPLRGMASLPVESAVLSQGGPASTSDVAQRPVEADVSEQSLVEADALNLSEAQVATTGLAAQASIPEAQLPAQPSDGFQATLEGPQRSLSEEGTVSLRQRLMDSVQDDPELVEGVVDETISISTEVVSVLPASHQVRQGETLWSIARIHGVDLDLLQTVNGVTDPGFLLPGDKLNLPKPDAVSDVGTQSDVSGVSSNVSETFSRSDDAPDADRDEVGGDLTDLPLPDSVNPVSSHFAGQPTPQLPEAPAQPDIVATESTMSIDDPYVARLLSDVAATHEDRQAEPGVSVDGQESTQVLNSTANSPAHQTTGSDAQEQALLEPDKSVAAVQAPASSGEAVDTAPDVPQSPSFTSEELLAAAPLGSDVYAPVMESLDGKVVSPELPILPGQEEFLPEVPNRFDGYMWPAHGVLTSGYGWRWGRMHRGIDVAGPVGTPIFAAAAGVVVRAGWNSGGYGKLVDVRHPDGSLTRYAHNSRLLVEPGQQVRQGQQIAEMGSTGYSTGPHLHFEIHLPEQGSVNPIAYLPN